MELKKQATLKKVLENLDSLIGKKFDEEEVIIAFADFEVELDDNVMFSYDSFGDVTAYRNDERATDIELILKNGIVTFIRIVNSERN